MPAIPDSNPTYKTLPGFESPAVGFESPFEMLEACHERVQRTLKLLVRLQVHVKQQGCDAQARQAAQDVMRYFDLAAPLHHEDEELHVFPAITVGGNSAQASTVKLLVAQHRQMEVQWAAIRNVLAGVISSDALLQPTGEALSTKLVADFVALYNLHIQTEEDVVYPAANALLDLRQKSVMGHDMRRRRGAPDTD